ncbi:hypothetical protein BT93_L0508 [Corymbia citriodora subsp. variegata]|uniref:DUF538 domain-containing protein n=1 Tax=Corymbia citriodora subsp. variegata TaxID=360336 RepID=A0A8T0CZL0_CORYI|nr:hypothetical protein BT93_L0508 [Corymbia citriodora subsp. variegata]
MTSELIETHRENAEVYQGDSVCKLKSRELLSELNLPRGLLPLDDVVEVGYNRPAGFVWVRQSKPKVHRFAAISRTVSYDAEVTAFVGDRRMKRLTGIKSKEFLFWVTISDIHIDQNDPAKISFANSTGLSRSFPVSAFEVEDEEEKEKDGEGRTDG